MLILWVFPALENSSQMCVRRKEVLWMKYAAQCSLARSHLCGTISAGLGKLFPPVQFSSFYQGRGVMNTVKKTEDPSVELGSWAYGLDVVGDLLSLYGSEHIFFSSRPLLRSDLLECIDCGHVFCPRVGLCSECFVVEFVFCADLRVCFDVVGSWFVSALFLEGSFPCL